MLGLSLSYLKARYRQTILGFGWAVLPTIILVFTVVFIFPSVSSSFNINGPYILFVFIGFWVWTFFSSALSFAIPNLVQNVNLLRKIYFPREILIVSAIIPVLVDYFVGLLIIICLGIYYGITIKISLIILPALFIIQVFLILGISFLGSIANVAFRDVSKLLPTMLQVLFFISPIIYPLNSVSDRFRIFLIWNPISGIIEGYRNIFIYGTFPDPTLFYCSFISSIVIFMIGYHVFKKGEQFISDII